MSATPSSESTPLYRPHDEAPACADLRPAESGGAWKGLSGHHLEFVSRGDFVSGSVHFPKASPAPLLVLLHGTGSSANHAELDFGVQAVENGYAVARIDLPLHGHRASPKLSDRLVTGYQALVRGESLDADSGALLQEFARQSTSDVSRCAAALAALPQVDAKRIAFAGHGIGAAAAIWAAPVTPGLTALVVKGEVGPMANAELSPAALLASDAAWNAARPAFLAIESSDENENAGLRALAECAPNSKRLSAGEADPRAALLDFLNEATNAG